jgi:hypothetical protein
VASLRNVLGLFIAALVLVSCVGTSGPSKREMIIGSWQSEIQGQKIVLTYSETEIAVADFGMSFPYEWIDDDTIRMDAMGQIVEGTVEFVTPDEMIQTSNQGTQRMLRVK